MSNIFFLLGLSHRNIYEKIRVIHIHKKPNKIPIDKPKFFITTSDKNQDIHPNAAISLYFQKTNGAVSKSFISLVLRVRSNTHNPQIITYRLKNANSQWLTTSHHHISAAIALHDSTKRIFEKFLGNLSVEKSILPRMITQTVTSVIKKAVYETSLNKKNDESIIKILLRFRKGIITDSFSSL